MKATAKELRFHSKELLDAVARGEEVVITYRGKACAKMVPVAKPSRRKFEESRLYGLWKEHDDVQDVEEYMDSVRSSRV